MKFIRIALVAALLFAAVSADDEDRGDKERIFKGLEMGKEGLKFESETETGDRKDKIKLEVELRAGKEDATSSDGVLRVKYEYEGEADNGQTEIEEQTEIKVRFLGVVEHEGDAAFTRGAQRLRSWPTDFLGQGGSDEERKTNMWTEQGMTGAISDGQLTATASSSLTFAGAAGPTVVEFIGHASTIRRVVGNETGRATIRPTDFKFDVHVSNWPWASDASRLSLLFKIDSKYEFESEHEDRDNDDDDGDDDDDAPKNALVGGSSGAGAREESIERRPAFFWEPVISVDGADRNVISSPLNVAEDSDDSEDEDGKTKWISFSYDGAAVQAADIFWDPSVTAFYAVNAPADSGVAGLTTMAGLAVAAVLALIA